jgi:polysaccharide biosynthesis transport protein
MEVWKYYRILRRWQWVIAAAMVAGVIAGLHFYRPSISAYNSTATLLVPAGDLGLPTNAGGGENYDRFDEALGLIWSREIAERVIQNLQLDMSVVDLHLRLNTYRDAEAPLIHVSVSGRTPAESITLTNALADAVADHDRAGIRRQFTLAREFVERELNNAEADLGARQQAFRAFQERNQSDLTTAPAGQIQNLEAEAQQTDLTLTEIEARLASTRSQLQSQSPTHVEAEISNNPIAESLKTDLVRLELALATELTVHTEDHPHVIELKGQIQVTKDRLNTELSKVVSAERVVRNPVYDALLTSQVNLETDRLAAQAKKDALVQVLASVRRGLPTYVDKEAQLAAMAESINSSAAVVRGLQTDLANARVREQESQAMSSLTVVDRATTAQPNPFQQKRFVLTAALFLSLLLALGLVSLLEYLDTRIKTPQRAEGLLEVPALAAIPQHNPPFDEAYRMLRANLMASEHGEGTEVIAVTGTKPGAGVSTVVANLARVFARAGQRTIVVDAAIHHPDQHKRFRVENDKGLADILKGQAAVSEALVPTDITNLELLPSGAAARTIEGDALFGTPAMLDLLSELKQRADVVLLDTSPASVFAATLDIAPLASGVVLVLDAGQTPRGIEQQVKTQLSRVGANVLGFVLTKVKPDLVDSYYYQTRQKRSQWRRRPAVAGAAVGMFLVLVTGGLFIETLLRTHSVGHLPVVSLDQIVARWVSFLSSLR